MAEDQRKKKNPNLLAATLTLLCAVVQVGDCTPGIQQGSAGSGDKQGLLSTCLGQPEHRLEPAGQADKLDREGQKLQWRINSLRRRERWVRYTRRGGKSRKTKFTSSALTLLSIPQNSSEGIERRVSAGEVNASCGEATALGGLNRVEKPKPATVWLLGRIEGKKRKRNKEVAQEGSA